MSVQDLMAELAGRWEAPSEDKPSFKLLLDVSKVGQHIWTPGLVLGKTAVARPKLQLGVFPFPHLSTACVDQVY